MRKLRLAPIFGVCASCQCLIHLGMKLDHHQYLPLVTINIFLYNCLSIFIAPPIIIIYYLHCHHCTDLNQSSFLYQTLLFVMAVSEMCSSGSS